MLHKKLISAVLRNREQFRRNGEASYLCSEDFQLDSRMEHRQLLLMF